MTLRVRGKQWYWVYKSDIKDLSNLFQSNLIFNKINGGSFNNYYTGADILLFRNNDFSTFINNKKKSNLDFFFNYVDDTVLNESISTNDSYYFINKNKYLNKSFYKKKLTSCRVLGIESNYTNPVQQHFFSNRPDLKKNYVTLFYKNFFNGYELSIDFLKYYKKINQHKYDILIQKSIDNWVKENGINYNNFFNYNLFYDHNSYNNFRLLRVNKSLILPSDSFIDVITNSFDVIHSWFIPGLGFKMDCVPGRSTHHNLYIDLPGVYYGQCAEICGRLHHHMPIKLCALPYEHYIVMYMSYNNNLKNYNKWAGNYL
jgi:heme/copper-type cytochrome/quinol oxidase subunit 2